jgi:citrate lyase subunit beta/citryl-CoA lyase
MRGRRFGFDGKLAIHPAQIGVIHKVFTPSAEDALRAQRLVDAYEAAVSAGRGTTSVDGQLVDLPVAAKARALIARREWFARGVEVDILTERNGESTK